MPSYIFGPKELQFQKENSCSSFQIINVFKKFLPTGFCFAGKKYLLPYKETKMNVISHKNKKKAKSHFSKNKYMTPNGKLLGHYWEMVFISFQKSFKIQITSYEKNLIFKFPSTIFFSLIFLQCQFTRYIPILIQIP